MADYGGFTSPGYPGTYPANLDCEWNITVSSGDTVVLRFDEFHVEHSFFCMNDMLMVSSMWSQCAH